MKHQRLVVLTLWLAFVAGCLWGVARTSFVADLSAFLPTSPTAEQKLLVDQLKDGVVSRLVLVGLEGGDAAARQRVSKALAERLRGTPDFLAIHNGQTENQAADHDLVLRYRYLLSPAVSAERFTAPGLADAIGESIDLVASPAGTLFKPLLTRDPTGEVFEIVSRMEPGSRPLTENGVWVSRDRQRALLLAHTRVGGSDIDGQQRILETLRREFAAVAQAENAAAVRILMTGPAVFAVSSRAAIEDEVGRLALASLAIIVTLLLTVFRSFTAVVLSLLPVLTGALAGVIAVSLGFGSVHGLTLGFGTTLMGEAVDYAIYMFVQARGCKADAGQGLWRTIRLGLVTSLAGFLTLALSDFPGLAQLGLYSLVGLITAVLTARFVLPALAPPGFQVHDTSRMGARLDAWIDKIRPLRWLLLLLAIGAVITVAERRDRLWAKDISSLSPVAPAEQELDAKLRADLGAPDVRYIIVVRGDSLETTLRRAEAIEQPLLQLVEAGVIGGFETPARYLPSLETQERRRLALPAPADLANALNVAARDLPLRADRLQPFLADVSMTKELPPLQIETLKGSSLATAVDSLLITNEDGWTALLPLRGPRTSTGVQVIAPEKVRAVLAQVPAANAWFIDMKAESDRMYSGYLNEALMLSSAGALAILVVLALALRSPGKVLRIVLPLVASVLLVIAGLVLAGTTLGILHLVGMLLIIAVGSNYALFFEGSSSDNPKQRPTVLASLLFANLTTVSTFGLLAFSNVPVLHAIGITVGPGTMLALLFSAILSRRTNGRSEDSAIEQAAPQQVTVLHETADRLLSLPKR